MKCSDGPVDEKVLAHIEQLEGIDGVILGEAISSLKLQLQRKDSEKPHITTLLRSMMTIAADTVHAQLKHVQDLPASAAKFEQMKLISAQKDAIESAWKYIPTDMSISDPDLLTLMQIARDICSRRNDRQTCNNGASQHCNVRCKTTADKVSHRAMVIPLLARKVCAISSKQEYVHGTVGSKNARRRCRSRLHVLLFQCELIRMSLWHRTRVLTQVNGSHESHVWFTCL